MVLIEHLQHNLWNQELTLKELEGKAQAYNREVIVLLLQIKHQDLKKIQEIKTQSFSLHKMLHLHWMNLIAYGMILGKHWSLIQKKDQELLRFILNLEKFKYRKL